MKTEKNFEKSWRSLWKKSKGSIYQSIEWAKARKNCGEDPTFITVQDTENEEIRAGILGFNRKKQIPLFGKKKIFFSEGNPLAIKDEDKLRALKKFKEMAKNSFYGTSYGTVVKDISKVYNKSGFSKITNHTILINLNKNIEEIWKSLEKKSARWGVKTAEKNGLVLKKETTQDEINDFYNLYLETAKQGNFIPEKKEFIDSLQKSGIGKVFLVKKFGVVLGGGLILKDINNNYTILNLTSCSKEGIKMQAMPFLYWNLIKYCKFKGFDYLDLGGYDTEAMKGNKFYNINKFKERFGGEVQEQPIFSTNRKYKVLRDLLSKFGFLRKLYGSGVSK